MTPPTDSVRALLADGWTEQACPDTASAVALFDRLRELNPTMSIERMHGGRAVETARCWRGERPAAVAA